MSKAPEHMSQQDLESYLWGAANLLRGLIDAGDYKQYVFPLLFFKRLSDVWDEERETALDETGDEAYARATADDRFAIPEGAHWSDVRGASRDVGRALLNAFRAIEAANPDRLSGAFGNASWTDKSQLPDETLKNLIEHFSKHTLSLAAVPEDELGNGYEYLIKQFADDSGHTAQEFYTNRTLVHLALYNGMIDKRPRLIARCVDAADVMTAVNFGRDQGLLIAVRGGGHNGPGLGSCDDGLMIDLSMMTSVRVDRATGTARVDPGCTSGDVDHATHPFGLAVPFGIFSTTGVAGLTLGGGTGYLTRKYGLTVDNLLEADVVLADGSFVTASPTEHADLFWALRGGGGNFGVVTSFLFQAHPVSMVYGGPIFWDAMYAKAVMQTYRDYLPQAPEELGIFVGLKTVPSMDPFPREGWGKRACAIIGIYDGSAADGEKALAPILDAVPTPIFNWMSEIPFPAMQGLFDVFYPAGLQGYWKGDFVASLPDEAIDTHIAQAAKAPSELSVMHLYPIDGAVQRVPAEATAWSARDAKWSMVIAGVDSDPGQAEALRSWGRAYWQAVHPFNLEGAYVNFMMDDEADGRVRASYGGNYQRLASIKRTYDPDNLFRVNQNIAPEAI